MTVPTQVGVYGGGRMGAGIAHAFLVSGAHVTVVESSTDSADAARERIETTLSRAVDRGHLAAGIAPTLARLTVSTDAAQLSDCGLVVEAVPERADLKREVLTSIERAAPDAWAPPTPRACPWTPLPRRWHAPKGFVGLHFVNPVPASQLVEIVVGTRTAPDLVDLSRSWVADLGKTPIAVSDSLGFASSRLGVAIALEAMRMLEKGVASAEEIDTAMELGYKHPIGPLRTTDIVGLDVRLAIAEHLAREAGHRFAPPSILREKVAAGHLGRKSGQGFYTW